MIRLPRPTPSTTVSHAAPGALLALVLLAPAMLGGATLARAQADSLASRDSSTAISRAAGAFAPRSDLAEELVRLGFQNVTAVTGAGDDFTGPWVAYENRRFRHASTALGMVARATGEPAWVFERRLGMVAAAMMDSGTGEPPSEVRYPSDGRFPWAPSQPVLAPTRKSVDLVVGPLLTYELARILDPVLIRVELQPEIRYNPWPGGRARLALVIPVRNDFEADSLHPDVNKVRPGPMMFEQYAWSRGAALVSVSGGLLGNNRYGASFGVARPLRRGEWLLDSQADVTGFFAVSDSGINYSTPSRWTGFVGVAYRPPGLDLSVRLRAARFIHEDQGFELEVRRFMGDMDVAFFVQRVRVSSTDEESFSLNSGGVRLVFPVPPMVRPGGQPVRIMPVERFPFAYREESEPVGESVSNVASREDYLRQLDRSALLANGPRYRAGLAGARYRHVEERAQWVSWTGMTGFVNTPWAGVLGDKEFELGYNRMPRAAAWNYRGLYRNDQYYATFGFLPRVEVGLRWTVLPGFYTFRPLVPESNYQDADRMFSVRLEAVKPGPRRPGLAVGIEDVEGSRRFHSTYAVAGFPFVISRLQNRVTLGYAPRVFDDLLGKEVSVRTLDGLFGAFEVSPWRNLAIAVEHDSEKVNSSLSVDLGFGLRARAAVLDFEHVAVGAGWFKAL